ncbi:hypothetical protein E8E12_004717 [Didymella heteroderae]|uniref:Uncharacterized protein n=1 Tax=Didymella heteroderae TaxID=1769908 RepID=A0A9P4WI78_9PLEO|nr:hypothetical protein E8E12_004717 [Didymella heteroderae]
MSNIHSKTPATLNLEGHDDVPVGQSTSSANDSTSYTATRRALTAIPSLSRVLLESNFQLDPDIATDRAEAERHERAENGIHANSPGYSNTALAVASAGDAGSSVQITPSGPYFRQGSPDGPSLGQNSHTDSLSSALTPTESPFSDPIPPERRSTPSTDKSRTELSTSNSSVVPGGYSYGDFIGEIRAENAQSSSLSNGRNESTHDARAITATLTSTVVRRHTSMPSLRSSSGTTGRSTVIPRMPNVQSTFYARPRVTLEEIDASSAEAGEFENEDLAPVQTLPDLPPRREPPANTTLDRFGRWLVNNFHAAPNLTPQVNVGMSTFHGSNATASEPRLLSTDRANQGQQQQQQQQQQ